MPELYMETGVESFNKSKHTFQAFKRVEFDEIFVPSKGSTVSKASFHIQISKEASVGGSQQRSLTSLPSLAACVRISILSVVVSGSPL